MGLKQNIQFWKYPQILKEKDALIQERDLLRCQRDSLEEQKEQLIQEREKLLREKEAMLQEKEVIFDKLGHLNLDIPEIRNIIPELLDIRNIKNKAQEFRIELDAKKQELAPSDFAWYPYDTLGNFISLDHLLTGKNRFLLDLIGQQTCLDIGCADGDTAFFLESLGCKMQVVDFAPTNFNKLQGVKLLKESLSSTVEIYEVNLDEQFVLPEKNYSLVFFLGILYHLRNPFYVLNSLAKVSKYCLISTRIAQFNTRNEDLVDRTNISSIPMAYLLDELEANNDSTNYWIFSDAGLRRLLKRTGWEICDYITVGDTVNSDPASPEGDERAFCLARSLIHQD